MDITFESAVAFINASLAPAVLLTGVGLLLAGLQTKYSTIVSVIRLLNRERRLQGATDAPRRFVLDTQLVSLMRRAKLIRNSICSFYLTIFFLVGTSILIGLRILSLGVPVPLVLASFCLSLFFLFAGIAFATREALLSYQIVQVETNEWAR